MRRFFLIALLAFLPAARTLAAPPEYLPATAKPTLHSPLIKEASGLAGSSRDPRFLWIINDSGSAPEIHLATTDGTYRGKIALAKTSNIDWEDLASFSLDGVPYLIVADIGDNDAKRKTRTLHILREPRLPADGKKLRGSARSEWKIRYRYEGGPRDCESIAVDVPNKKILLLTKRTHPPELHELPLRPSGGKSVITTHRTAYVRLTAPGNARIPFGNQPTGLDISSNNKLAAVVTYYSVFLFPRADGESWPQAFVRKPIVLPPHLLKQAESIAFSNNANTLFALSEGQGSPIVSYVKTPEANSKSNEIP